MDLITAAYIWLRRHSSLRAGDGILLGASSMEQLEGNLTACVTAEHCDPLPGDLLSAFDQAWEITAEGAFPYWRSYSLDQPGRSEMDPGASYSAHHKK
jgi:aflatoxin B1 aldehyde reductase